MVQTTTGDGVEIHSIHLGVLFLHYGEDSCLSPFTVGKTSHSCIHIHDTFAYVTAKRSELAHGVFYHYLDWVFGKKKHLCSAFSPAIALASLVHSAKRPQ